MITFKICSCEMSRCGLKRVGRCKAATIFGQSRWWRRAWAG